MALKKGDTGKNVRKLQEALRAEGFDIDVDGDFGNETHDAVRAFQTREGLDVDGIAGQNTLAALGLGLLLIVLKHGDAGENVEKLQEALRAEGFDIDVDGDFGNQTRTAVREFQQREGLDVDGIAGQDTLAALGLDADGDGRIFSGTSSQGVRIDVLINGDNDPATNYINWAPTNCRIILVETGGATNPVRVRLRNRNTNSGGQVIFFDAVPGNGQDELQLDLPIDGTPVNIFIAGKIAVETVNNETVLVPFASIADKDAVIEVVDTGGAVLATESLMVRIRKNANELTTDERDRFISAMATLNDRGMGRFSDFRNMHTSAGDPEAHSNSGFLPWHRAYLLDLERELQRIDPSVTIPYWRFDQPAPKLFTRDFIGVSTSTGTVDFANSNPLSFWATDGAQGVTRTPGFNTQTQSAFVIDEADTLVLGTGYSGFRGMEGNPHGSAHVSFGGFISSIPTAAKDPLFFMLHANVDRLWAKWQWLNRRFNLTSVDTFDRLGSAGDLGSTRVGHNLNDTMWPWNQITRDIDGLRPPTAPGGNLADSLVTASPGPTPTVGDMIDFQSVSNPGSHLGFDYDDVPFQF